MKHETSQKKARYAYNVSDDAGVITHTLSDMKGNVIWKEIYKNQEPVGIWQTESGVQLDYNFELKYYSESTDSAAYKLLTPFIETYPPSYTTESIVGEYRFLSKNFHFPNTIKMENINGQLSMCFNIEQDGSISGLANYQSLNPALDKEAMRIARMFRYEEPAIYHDERVVYPWGMTLYFPIKN